MFSPTNSLLMHLRRVLLPVVTALITLHTLHAQTPDSVSAPVDPTDTLVDIYLPDVDVVAHRRAYKPLSPEERQKYWRRVRDVKKVLPFARMLTQMMLETYEYLGTFETERERDRHLERVKEDLVDTYTPVMKTWTLSQGTLLIKLMDRQTGVSGYKIIKSIYGGFTAFSYNLMALFYGGDLKERYDPQTVEDDAVTERIIYLVDHNMI